MVVFLAFLRKRNLWWRLINACIARLGLGLGGVLALASWPCRARAGGRSFGIARPGQAPPLPPRLARLPSALAQVLWHVCRWRYLRLAPSGRRSRSLWAPPVLPLSSVLALRCWEPRPCSRVGRHTRRCWPWRSDADDTVAPRNIESHACAERKHESSESDVACARSGARYFGAWQWLWPQGGAFAQQPILPLIILAQRSPLGLGEGGWWQFHGLLQILAAHTFPSSVLGLICGACARLRLMPSGRFA